MKKDKKKARLWGYKEWVSEVPRSRSSTSVGSAIRQLLARLGMLDRLKEQEAVIIWAEVVDEEIAQVTVPKSIQNGILRVSVSDASWRNELLYRKEEIRARLNEELGSSVVEDIKFS